MRQLTTNYMYSQPTFEKYVDSLGLYHQFVITSICQAYVDYENAKKQFSREFADKELEKSNISVKIKKAIQHYA